MIYIFQFFVFSFVGWVIDSLYCSFSAKKWIWSGYFKGVPLCLCPIYGFAGVLVVRNFKFLQTVPLYLTISLVTIEVITFDYFSNLLLEVTLQKKLWDYSSEHPNYQGKISLWHSFLILIGVSGMYILKVMI